MKSEKLLRSLGQIDERYIMEAAPKSENNETRKQNMAKHKTIRFFPRPMAAVLALCVCLSGVTALAAAGDLQGFFADVLGKNGAIVGTAYEQAADEVVLTAWAEEGQLRVQMAMVSPDRMPYREFESLGIGHYQILDADRRTVMEGKTEMAAVSGGRAGVGISLEELPAGSYLLRVTALTGGKKADQPLVLSGAWECGFTK